MSITPSTVTSTADAVKNALVTVGETITQAYVATKLMAPVNPTFAAEMLLAEFATKMLTSGQMTAQEVNALVVKTQQAAAASEAQFEKVLANSPTAPA